MAPSTTSALVVSHGSVCEASAREISRCEGDAAPGRAPGAGGCRLCGGGLVGDPRLLRRDRAASAMPLGVAASVQVIQRAAAHGHGSARVASNGSVDQGSIFTQDGQAAVSFVPGAFVAPADRLPVTIHIKPVAEFPDPDGTHLSTNVYCVTSSSPLAPGKDVLVTLQFSDQLPAPSDIYEYQGDGPWQKIGSTGSAAPFYIAARASSLGCFAAGYQAMPGRTRKVPGLAEGRRCRSSWRWRSCW
jgi:hypothetical protein